MFSKRWNPLCSIAVWTQVLGLIYRIYSRSGTLSYFTYISLAFTPKDMTTVWIVIFWIFKYVHGIVEILTFMCWVCIKRGGVKFKKCVFKKKNYTFAIYFYIAMTPQVKLWRQLHWDTALYWDHTPHSSLLKLSASITHDPTSSLTLMSLKSIGMMGAQHSVGLVFHCIQWKFCYLLPWEQD